MIQDLLIIGAGGDGRNIADLIMCINAIEEKWNILGYLDDDPLKQGLIINGVPVLGPLSDISKYDDCCFLGTFGSAKRNFNKKKIINCLRIPLDRFATLIHPAANVSPSAKIGRDTVIYAGTFVGANAVIGDHAKILANCSIEHDAVIGDFVTISDLVNILGAVNVGEGCYFGGNSAIKDNLNIGEWALIGMGAVIIRDVPPYCTVVGNPGRIIRRKDPSNFRLN